MLYCFVDPALVVSVPLLSHPFTIVSSGTAPLPPYPLSAMPYPPLRYSLPAISYANSATIPRYPATPSPLLTYGMPLPGDSGPVLHLPNNYVAPPY